MLVNRKADHWHLWSYIALCGDKVKYIADTRACVARNHFLSCVIVGMLVSSSPLRGSNERGRGASRLIKRAGFAAHGRQPK